MTAIPIITHQELLSLLSYDPESGEFRWKPRGVKRWDNKNAGQVAGSNFCHGCLAISIHKRKYQSHVLAWYYVHGVYPDQFVDHSNLNKKDNRISNLRLASPVENSCNTSMRSDNASGYRGVHFLAKRKCFYSKIRKDGKVHHIGYFKTAREGGLAYAKKAKEIFGEFCPEYLHELAAS